MKLPSGDTPEGYLVIVNKSQGLVWRTVDHDVR
jgi:hypothetical protein